LRSRSEKGQKKRDALPPVTITEDGEDLVFSCTMGGRNEALGQPPNLAPEQPSEPSQGFVLHREGSEEFNLIKARLANGEFTEMPIQLAFLKYQKKNVERDFDRAIATENKRLGAGPGAPRSWGMELFVARVKARLEGKELIWDDICTALGIPDTERKAAKHACKAAEYRLRHAARTVPQNKPSARLFPRQGDSDSKGNN
jgi:hypothetical protein